MNRSDIAENAFEVANYRVSPDRSFDAGTLINVSTRAFVGTGAQQLIGGFIVLVLNTAAIMAMLRHYREDRDFMYGLDIKFLDEARAAKR